MRHLPFLLASHRTRLIHLVSIGTAVGVDANIFNGDTAPDALLSLVDTGEPVGLDLGGMDLEKTDCSAFIFILESAPVVASGRLVKREQ